MKKNAFTLMEVLIGAFLFVMVAVICSAIFAYTVSNRNKAHQQNQINQTAKDFFEEIGQHIRSTDISQEIMICGISNFDHSNTDIWIGSEQLGNRKIGTELRIFYGSVNMQYRYYAYDKQITRSVSTGISDITDCGSIPIGEDTTTLNSSDIRLATKTSNPLVINDIDYLAFMGCDNSMTPPGDSTGFICQGHGPIIRVFIGLEGGIQIRGKGVSGTTSVFQTTFTTRRAP